MKEALHSNPSTPDERVELERLRAALDASGDIAYEWDLASDSIHWSANAHAAFGLAETCDISTRAHFVARIDAEDLATFTSTQNQHLKANTPYQVEYRLRCGEGSFCWVQDRGAAHCAADGRPERVVGTIRVITHDHEPETDPGWLLNYAEVTGHISRVRLRQALDHALVFAERYHSSGAYLLVAIDDLSMVGDVYGREAADRAVVAVGRALDQALRASDVIGRVAPDQFGIIINGCPENDVPVAADKILSAVLRTTVRTGPGSIQLTASIGGVSFPGTVHAAHDTMIKADVALAHARRMGQNCFVAYNFTEEQRSGRRRALATAKQIQTALQGDGLMLAFQPIVESATRRVAFYECLLRIPDGGEGYLPTGESLRVAENMGLIRLIDRRVLEMAVEELHASANVTLAINVSGLTTTDPAWLRRFVSLLSGRADVAERLIIEITETVALSDLDETVRFVHAVRNEGCRVALDDFGAGYTSFRHLKTLAVDTVKIDGSYVTHLASRPHDLLFVKTLVNLVRGFDLDTVAERVETEAVARILADEGVNYLQGYHFGKPAFERPWRTPLLAGPESAAAARLPRPPERTH